MIRKMLFASLLLTAISVLGSAQASSNFSENRAAASGERVSLTEELDKAIVEPNSKRFRLNIPFALGSYVTVSPAEGVVAHQYIWDNFSEGFIMLQYWDYPTGIIPSEPGAQKQWAIERANTNFDKVGITTTSERDIKVGNVLGKEFEGTLRGKKVTVRVFADHGVFYMLSALPVPDNAPPILQKLFDSFEFVGQ